MTGSAVVAAVAAGHSPPLEVGYVAEGWYPDCRKFSVWVLDVDLWDNPNVKD